MGVGRDRFNAEPGQAMPGTSNLEALRAEIPCVLLAIVPLRTCTACVLKSVIASCWLVQQPQCKIVESNIHFKVAAGLVLTR